MLGGAVSLPSSAAAAASAAAVAAAAHKQFHPNSPPLDLDSWKEVFLQQQQSSKNDDNAMEPDASDVSSTGGAINLSSRPSSAPTTQNQPSNMDGESSGDQIKANEQATNLNEDSQIGSNGKLSPLHALFTPGLQQMQQFLQSQLQQVASAVGGNNSNSSNINHSNNNNNNNNSGSGFNPSQLQHFMQQQQQSLMTHHQQLADAGRKQLEQLMHQLQEQLQINLLQQTHLMQTSSSGISDNNKGGGKATSTATAQAMQQLQIQQQQLISQLQLVQQRILMMPNFHQQQRKDEFIDRSGWKENGDGRSSPKQIGNKSHKMQDKEDNNRLPALLAGMNNNDSDKVSPHTHPLFQHGVCQWPGCDSHYSDLVSFLKHVGTEHILDDKSTAQARVQMQIVAQLEHSLSKERDRLQAMMAHLHLTKDHSFNRDMYKSNKGLGDRNDRSHSEGPPHALSPNSNMDRSDNRIKSPPLKMRPPPVPPVPPVAPPPPGSLAAMQQAVGAAAAAAAASGGAGGFGHLPGIGPGGMGLPPTPLSALTAAARGSAAAAAAAAAVAGIPPPTSMGAPIRRRMTDKAPIPMTNGLPYMFDRAGLDIAQEIHRNREFYRTNDVRPPFTYASLIRQAILLESPNRQLTLGDIYKWFTTNFKYFRTTCNLTWKNAVRHNLSLHKCFMRVENVKGAVWTVDEVEYHRRRPQRGAASGAKSPSFAPSPSMYSDALNASLQSALGFAENNLPFLGHSSASMASLHHHHQQQQLRDREEKALNDRPSSVDYAAKILGSSASSYLSPSSMSDSENNNHSSETLKGDDRGRMSPLENRRMGRKRTGDELDDDPEENNVCSMEEEQAMRRGRHTSAGLVEDSEHLRGGNASPRESAYDMDYPVHSSNNRDQPITESKDYNSNGSNVKEELTIKDLATLQQQSRELEPDSNSSNNNRNIKREKY